MIEFEESVDRIVNPNVAEYWGGERDGSVMAFSGTVPPFVKEAIAPEFNAVFIEGKDISPYLKIEERTYERRVFVGKGGYQKFVLVYPEYKDPREVMK